MPILLAYPEVHYFPPIPVETNDDVFAVAVRETVVLNGNPLLSDWTQQEFTILTPNQDSLIRTSPRIKFDRVAGFIMVLSKLWGELHDSELRLYRRGFKLVKVETWPDSPEITWIPATTHEEQKQAIDDLIYVNRSQIPHDPDAESAVLDNDPKYGSDYSQVLQFAAREYQWCAEQAAAIP